MRTEQPEFFYVDPTTEVVGVLRGIQNAKARKVAVVLPEDPRLFRNDINLRLIASYAEKSNKDVVLITIDPAVAKVAYAHGLHVYDSPASAWKPEGRVFDLDITQPLNQVEVKGRRRDYKTGKMMRTRRHYQRALVMITALFAVAAVWYVATPQVTVVVTPAVKYISQEMHLPLIAPGVAGEGVRLNMLEIPVEVSADQAATGRRTEGVTAAAGSVLFINDTEKAIAVPAGTLVSTDGGQIFLTLAGITVPPVQAEYFMNVVVGMKAGQAEVAVRAQKTGSGGNVASGRIRLLPQGPNELKVVNPEATYGGADRSVTYVTATDIANAHRAASAVLIQKAVEIISARLGDDTIAYMAQLTVQEGEMRSSANVDQEAAQVTVWLTGKARVPYILKQDVLDQAAKAIKAGVAVPAGYEQFGPIQAQYEGDSQAQADLPLSVSIQAVIPVVKSLDDETVKRQVAGMEPGLAAEALSDIGVVEIKGKVRKYLPRWTPWLRVVLAKPAEPGDAERIY